MNSVETLNKHWGFSEFRPLQKDIVEAVASGKDVLALLPTGGGKSICFQVPGMMREGIVIVISPLIALMKDQVENLLRRNIKAAAIVSGMKRREVDITLDNCVYGDIKFLYVSPERLKTEIFVERLKRMNVAFFAIDEAHCISQWGYDFRPPYLEIARIRELKPEANMIALTATATPGVRSDIVKYLELKNPEIFVKSFSRKNLSYSVRKSEDKNNKMIEILNKVKGCAIIYASTRRRTKEISDLLNKKGITSQFYNAGLTMEDRIKRQEAWIKNEKRIMVATNAFGMGIDKPDVRLVIHMDLPSNIEAYYQEAGRAGRDEKKAYAVIIYQEKDTGDLIERVENSRPSLSEIKRVYQALANNFKIAIGSYSDQLFPFDSKEFCNTFNLNPIKTSAAIKVLETEGLVTTSDGYKNPSKVFITCEPNVLYEKQVRDISADKIIKAILRLHGGDLFNSYQVIDENRIAHLSELSLSEVVKKLESLKDQGFLDYSPGSDEPTLGFLTPRIDASDLRISNSNLIQRAKLEKEKAASMAAYVENIVRCRTLQLLDYFGEVSYHPCGVCDVCVARKNEGRKVNKDEIMNKLSDLPVSLPELLSNWPASMKDNVLDEIRELVDKGLVKFRGTNEILRS